MLKINLFYVKSHRWHNLFSFLQDLYCETLAPFAQEVWSFINSSMLKYNKNNWIEKSKTLKRQTQTNTVVSGSLLYCCTDGNNVEIYMLLFCIYLSDEFNLRMHVYAC